MTGSLLPPNWPLVSPNGWITKPWYTYLKGQDEQVRDTVTNVAAAPSKTQTFIWPVLIEAPKEQDYILVLKAPFAGTIKKTISRSAGGTCTATFKINTTVLGGTANSVSTTEQEQEHASDNEFAVGEDIVVTISDNSSCDRASLTIEYERVLA